MLLLWAILFFVVAIMLGVWAFGGIAIAVSFFTKLLFIGSLMCFLVALILVIIERMWVKKQ